MFNFNISNTLKICVYIVDFYTQNKYESQITSNTFDYGCDRLLYTVANQRGIWGYCVYEIVTY